jgi:hypothetical protein
MNCKDEILNNVLNKFSKNELYDNEKKKLVTDI